MRNSSRSITGTPIDKGGSGQVALDRNSASRVGLKKCQSASPEQINTWTKPREPFVMDLNRATCVPGHSRRLTVVPPLPVYT
jgi:hypothetical protein